MRLSKKCIDKITEVYKPDMTAEELSEAAGVPLFKGHRYLAQKLFEDEILSCRQQGISYREIGRKLDVPHATAHRVVKPLDGNDH